MGNGIYVSRLDTDDWEPDEDVGGSAHMLFDESDASKVGLWRSDPGPTRGPSDPVVLPARETIVVLEGTVRVSVDDATNLDSGAGGHGVDAGGVEHRVGRRSRLQGDLGLLLVPRSRYAPRSKTRLAARPFNATAIRIIEKPTTNRIVADSVDDRRESESDPRIHLDREGGRGRARREERDDELVERQGEGDQRARDDPRAGSTGTSRGRTWRPCSLPGPAPPPRPNDRSSRAGCARSRPRRSWRRRRVRRRSCAVRARRRRT